MTILIVLLKYFTGPIAIVIIIFFLLLKYPEKVEKWLSLIIRAFYFITRKGGRKIVSLDIQGRINEFSKSLKKELPNFIPVGVRLQWITEKETPSEFILKNRLVIRMREHPNQNKNFVNASMVFVSKIFLTKTKKYLSKSFKESVDLFVAKKLFEKEKPEVLDQFFEDYFSEKALNNEKIMELLEKYDIIDKVGLFYPVLIQELNFLGEKVFFKQKSANIERDIKAFVEFLKNYANRDVGEEEIPKNYEGTYCRCGIVIIARSLKLAIGDTKPFTIYIKKLIDNKLENIYLIGSAQKSNMEFIDQIATEAQENFNLQKYYSKVYKAEIKIHGKRVEVKSYLILLRSSEVLRYYGKEYQEKFVK